MFFNKTTFNGGIHVPGHKDLTKNSPIIQAKAPHLIFLPLSMHIGAPAKAIVKPGQKVKLGELIAKADGFISSNIHSSVSGMVLRKERRWLPNGVISECIVIKNDFCDTFSEDAIKPTKAHYYSPDDIRRIILEKGIVGMGGATFPTHVKYAPQKPNQAIDTIIINGIECEPFITADEAAMLEQAPLLIEGIHLLMQAALAKKAVIAIETNKPEAIEHLNKLLENEEHISVVECAEKYPQGSEKHLVYATTKRIIAERALPASVGVIVNNVATVIQVALAVNENRPLIERIVTVSGNAINKPGNYKVRIGTLYSDLIKNTAGGHTDNLSRIISGGMMMGFSLDSLDYPVIKGTSGLLLFNHDSKFANIDSEGTCVRCGKCVDICPMHLEPTLIVSAVKERAWGEALNAQVLNCIECGACAYACPANIPLTQYMRMGKQFIMTKGIGEQNRYYKK